ncbi:transglutaminase family protein [Egbenema bharatensis]|uniref:transglutaminase family protein n=1 Tax=Egbenema bharatensis TaxID=3463334 RepID=UPI003A85BB62
MPIYYVEHSITYTYDRPVELAPHTIRLRPRCDITQKLHAFTLAIEPEPTRVSEILDLDGNSIYRVWFQDEPLSSLSVKAVSEVKTFRENPFDYLLEPWAISLPIDYPVSLNDRLQPYLRGQFSRLTGDIDPAAIRLAQDIWDKTTGNVVPFLSELNQQIYQNCSYTLRETGAAMPAGITWTTQSGSCRDYAVLFIEVCRAVGLAARFVSGYQEGDLDSNDRHLHAWAEVYLPGAGWRGYDPTHGLATADTHIALVTSPTSKDTAPVAGTFKQGRSAQSNMNYELRISRA